MALAEARRMKLLFALLLMIGTLSAQSHSTTLSWSWSQGSGDPAAGFHIWKAIGTTAPSTSGTPYATVSSPSIMSYTDTGVVAGQTATYVVTAYNPGGDSVPSPSATCTTPFQAPAAPTSLQGSVK